jgi:hypothetical protein
MNILFEIIYYLLFVGLGFFMIGNRDAWASKLVGSQRMSGFIFKRPNPSETNERIRAKRLIIIMGWVFIAFGFFKTLQTVIELAS